MTKKEGNKKKDKNWKEFWVKNDKKTLSWFFTLVMIAIVISMVLSFLNRTRYVDRDVSFTQFIQNFNSWAY